MSNFTEFFKQCEELAESLGHRLVTVDHLALCIMQKQSIIDFFEHINMDPAKLVSEIEQWLKEMKVPEYGSSIQEQLEEDRVPFSSFMSRISFELNKKSVIEQLKDGDEDGAIQSYFILIECLSMPDTALTNALELNGTTATNIVAKLQHYTMDQMNLKLRLNPQMRDSLEEYTEADEDEDEVESSKTGAKMGKAIRSFTTDLTEQAAQGKLGKLIGRETELWDVIQILSRKNKKNAILVGDAGVGKTQIVDGLAMLIAAGKVPDNLKNAKICSLNLSSLVAGTKFRGELEERVESLIKELTGRDDLILFIDEMHNIMNVGGGSGGGLDFGNMLKPSLARGDIRIIGTTTYSEYRSHLEKDSAIARRLMKVDITEPTLEDTKKIISGVKDNYEKFHKVKFSADSMASVIEYSSQYLQNRKFPDKAIDLMDAAAARKKIKTNDSVSVEREDIAYEVARIANIPYEVVMCEESTRMSELEGNLSKRVFGQDEAVKSLVKNVMVARAGLREKQSVQGAFMFVGPSGTGKTEITKALADSMGVKLVRFDMSEFAQEHTVSKLIGSPPGYVGHDSGNGLLLDMVEQHPNCVLLLDEIEKAHKKVLLTFLQVMDEGRLTGSHGKTVHFNNVTIIMTTNLGARDAGVVSTGMSSSGGDGIDKAVKQFLPPEFINRIDSIVKFNELGEDVIMNVVNKFIEQLNDDLKPKNVKVTVNKAAKQWLASKGVSPGMGARPMKRVINENIRVPLAYEMLCGSLINGGNVTITVVDDKLAISEPKVKKAKEKAVVVG